MASKPKIATWATETNYTAPGKLWDGTPTKVLPVGDLFIPNTKPPAENFNALRSADKAEVQSVCDWSGTSPAQNWQAVQTLTGVATGGVPSGVSYDAINDQWLFAVSKVTTGGNLMIVTSDGYAGRTNQLGNYVSTTENAIVCLKDPTDSFTYYITSYTVTSGPVRVLRYDSSVGSPAWASTYAVGTTNVVDLKLSAFNGKIQSYVGGGTGTAPLIHYSTDKGLTWTLASYTPAVIVATWNVKSGQNEVLALPVQQAGATPFLVRSADGSTFTQISLSGLATSDVPIDIVSTGGSTWLMVVQTASNGIYFRQSSDGGLTWSTGTAVTSRNTGIPAAGEVMLPVLASFGQLVVCLTKLGTSSQGTIFSADGGVTWRAGLNTCTGTPVRTTPTLAQSSCQLMIANNVNIQPSYLGGVPSRALT